MVKINKHIEIVSSSISGQSSMSKKSYEMIRTALSKYYTEVGVSIVDTEGDLQLLVEKKPDLVFLGMKRVPAADTSDGRKSYVWLSDFLDNHNIPYTGSPTSAHKLDHSKDKAKDIVKGAGLKTSDFFTASKDEFTSEAQLTLDFPLFIKPPSLGGGAGIDASSVVRNFDEFTKKVDSLHDDHHSNALVEKYLTGREFTVAILRTSDDSQLQILPIEMLPKQNAHGDRVIGHEMKSSEEETAVSFVAEGSVRQAVMSLAEKVFIAIGARDYGRIDIRLDQDDIPHFLEANLIPSIINGSGNFQKACLINLDLDYEPMLLHIVELAMSRA